MSPAGHREVAHLGALDALEFDLQTVVDTSTHLGDLLVAGRAERLRIDRELAAVIRQQRAALHQLSNTLQQVAHHTAEATRQASGVAA